MKTLITFLTFIFLILFNSSCNYAIKKYTVDETGQQKLVAYSEYSYNMTPAMIEADYNSDIMRGIGEQVKPHSKKDAAQYVYMTETAALAGMEIGGRYYQSKGYGWKRISSHDGTVVGSVTNSYIPEPSAPEKISGTVYHNRKYYLVEDTNLEHPVNNEEAKLCAKYEKFRWSFISTWE